MDPVTRGGPILNGVYPLVATAKPKLSIAMDMLFSLQGIAACIILLGSVLALVLAIFLPRHPRGKVLRKVGRWFQ